MSPSLQPVSTGIAFSSLDISPAVKRLFGDNEPLPDHHGGDFEFIDPYGPVVSEPQQGKGRFHGIRCAQVLPMGLGA